MVSRAIAVAAVIVLTACGAGAPQGSRMPGNGSAAALRNDCGDVATWIYGILAMTRAMSPGTKPEPSVGAAAGSTPTGSIAMTTNVERH